MKNISQYEEIKELKGTAERSYILEKEDMFSQVAYRVMKGRENNWSVKIAKTLYNGHVKLMYFVSEYKPLIRILSEMQEPEVIAMLHSVMTTVDEIKENGFLKCNHLLLDAECMYIDRTTFNVKFLYFPINVSADDNEFVSDLKEHLLEIINMTPVCNQTKIKAIIQVLRDKDATLEDLQKELSSTSGKRKPVESPEIVKVRNNTMQLIAVEQMISFEIAKDEYVIGRGGDTVVDGIITFNPSIGRSHCKILRRDNQFYIVDLNSTNHTYLNKKSLEPQKMYVLQDGDEVILANSIFMVKI